MSSKAQFICQSCGHTQTKWSGQCPACDSWNSLSPATTSTNTTTAVYKKITEIASDHHASIVQTHLIEFDRILGGGIVSGMAVLLGGEPGIGKSTILTQVLAAIAAHSTTLYVSAEETLSQIAIRIHRLSNNANDLNLLATNDVDQIIDNIHKLKPKVVVIDSMQMLISSNQSGIAGSPSQVRTCALQLIDYAKLHGVAVFIIGHVTKDGAIAGPKLLEHMVDTVLYFEGDSNSKFRMLRSVKNRFGKANELGVFSMTDKGLQSITNPSAIFLSQFMPNREGTIITAHWEGSRALLIEIQALVDTSANANPRRVIVGVEQTRVAMLAAILHRYANLDLAGCDIFINAVGGVKLASTAPDLAIAIAMYTSLRQIKLACKLVVFGEIGLSGEIRPVGYGVERIIAAAKVGFSHAIVPKKNAPKQCQGITIHPVDSVQQALAIVDELHTIT